METHFTQENSITNYTLIDQEEALKLSFGTSKQSVLTSVTYNELVTLLGQPTFTSPSSDEKVQVEWVVKLDGETVTVYDYKTYDREYTLNKLTVWSVGGKNFEASDKLVSMIREKLNKEELD